jgi:hypothetical protein
MMALLFIATLALVSYNCVEFTVWKNSRFQAVAVLLLCVALLYFYSAPRMLSSLNRAFLDARVPLSSGSQSSAAASHTDDNTSASVPSDDPNQSFDDPGRPQEQHKTKFEEEPLGGEQGEYVFTIPQEELNPQCESMYNKVFDPGFCPMGDAYTKPAAAIKPNEDFFVWGDNQAHSLLPGLREYTSARKLGGLHICADKCPPVMQYTSGGADCEKFVGEVVNFIRRNRPKAVLLPARWNSYVGTSDLNKKLTDTIKMLLKDGGVEKVYLLWGIPESPHERLPEKMQAAHTHGKELNEFRIPREDADHQHAVVAEMMQIMEEKLTAGRVISVDARKFLCDDKYCFVMHHGISMYRSGNRLSPEGGRVVVKGMFADPEA